ncbi:phosphoadenosine phosphosulfate reductase [Aestuariicoccus sp. MJ-SS9]|uniref:phosphoadenosine phosphosulfate reductase n=1 Tax=Aestuariicoccus sp. MJ-SS9 TaxID=3079855 RepID=UPI0029079756|nr:phosphoadenosine phosphosulfate reductase [Aestuariicoccus sp. MJ-SS9]MDU8913337.1 phosphoadenosine phosphosulfate reductase [Aestuariicoccus sp. MJ-SS9]
MQDNSDLSALDLTDVPWDSWMARVSEVGAERGFAEDLGPKHQAIFVEDGDTLLVTFETFPGIQTLSDTGTPLGWDMVQAKGWSHLALISTADTWFRDNRVYGFFDQLIDDGFFDEFDNVVFYGAGPCGYAAAAFSVAAPGARVLVLQPQATLDPRTAEWDRRFLPMRRTDFTERYGYAPDMLDASDRAYVLYDPREQLDAMHSALFERRNVTRFRLPFMGDALQGDLIELDLIVPLLTAAADGSLDTAGFARMLRARRGHAPYLRKLLARLEAEGRPLLAEWLCRNVVGRMNAPRFRRKLEQLQAARAR